VWYPECPVYIVQVCLCYVNVIVLLPILPLFYYSLQLYCCKLIEGICDFSLTQIYFLISQLLNSHSDAVYSTQHAAAAAVSRPNLVQRSAELCVHVYRGVHRVKLTESHADFWFTTIPTRLALLVGQSERRIQMKFLVYNYCNSHFL